MARARAREHLSFYAAQPNYQRILMSQGFAQADLENGCSDHLIDTMIAWGTEEKIAERIDAHLAARRQPCVLADASMRSSGLPDERAFEALASR